MRLHLPSLCFAGLIFAASCLQAQVPGKYFPLDHRRPPGVAAQWNAQIQPGAYGQPQAVKVTLTDGGTVSFYQGSPHGEVPVESPAQVGLVVGNVYRVKLSNLPNRPGVDLFPTLELIDRLHPPVGVSQQFPIPIEITDEEIETALGDGMVTKVIYLEQPDFASPVETDGFSGNEDLPPTENLLAAADHRGRPLLILRLGGRIPDPNSPQDEFYSTSPILFTGEPATSTGTSLQLPDPVDPETGVVRGF